jgi:hypothetical protein
MSRLQISIFLIVFGAICYYVIQLLIRRRAIEGYISGASGEPVMMMDGSVKDVNLRQRDSHYFLINEINPGKKDIANLEESNPYHHDQLSVTTDKGIGDPNPDVVMARTRDIRRLKCIEKNDPVRPKVRKFQPVMYDRENIINYYDRPYYRDWRYPEQPIDLEFVQDPAGYCRRYPQRYPCYKYYSKW